MAKGSEGDPKAAAEATAQGNIDLARYTTEANRVNQYTPWGSLVWNQTPSDEKVFDEKGYNEAMNAWSRANDPSNPADWTSAAPSAADFYVSDPSKTKWTQSITVTPEMQRLLDLQQGLDLSKGNAAQTLWDQYQAQIQKPIDYSGVVDRATNVPQFSVDLSGVKALNQDAPVFDSNTSQKYSDAYMDRFMRTMNPQYDAQQQQIATNLALNGFAPTSDAYGAGVGTFLRQKNDAYLNAFDQSQLTGSQLANADYSSMLAGYSAENAARQAAHDNAYSDATTNFNDALASANYQNSLRDQQLSDLYTQQSYPLNQINALLGGSQVQMPSFPGFYSQQQTSGPDYMTANQQSANASNANAASTNSTLGTLALAAAMIACFAKGTMVLLSNGREKDVADLDIGDEMAIGGRVTFVGKSMSDDMYEYKGTKVSGCHVVLEGTKWMQVAESKHSKKLPTSAIVYPIVNEAHIMVTNGFVSTDYVDVPLEVNPEGGMTYRDRIRWLNSKFERNMTLARLMGWMDSWKKKEEAALHAV